MSVTGKLRSTVSQGVEASIAAGGVPGRDSPFTDGTFIEACPLLDQEPIQNQEPIQGCPNRGRAMISHGGARTLP